MDDAHLVHSRESPIVHSLDRYTVVICIMGVSSSSCGSVEAIAIAQMGVLNIVVSAMLSDARMSTTWLFFRTPCCLKMLSKVSNSTSRTPIFIATAFIVTPALKKLMVRSRKYYKSIKSDWKFSKNIHESYWSVHGLGHRFYSSQNLFYHTHNCSPEHM